MRKIILLLIVGVVFADVAIAQEVATEAAPTETSFFQIVLSSGILGIITWSVIFTMCPVGIVLGIFSCIASGVRKTNNLPLSFKWLILAPILYFFVGAIGVMWSMLRATGATILCPTCAKAVFLAQPISNSLYTAAFTFLGMVPFIFFIVLSVIILHVTNPPPPLEKLSDDGGGA